MTHGADGHVSGVASTVNLVKSRHSMSTREALIQEINKQPEALLREVQQFMAFLVEQHRREHAANHWPERYFDRTAGAFAGESLERPPQLPFEQREEW